MDNHTQITELQDPNDTTLSTQSPSSASR